VRTETSQCCHTAPNVCGPLRELPPRDTWPSLATGQRLRRGAWTVAAPIQFLKHFLPNPISLSSKLRLIDHLIDPDRAANQHDQVSRPLHGDGEETEINSTYHGDGTCYGGIPPSH